MSELLDSAVQELEQLWPALTEIVRVDADEDGEIMLTATDGRLTRWFVHDDRGLIERFPERDTKLPLAQLLSTDRDWKVLSYRPGRRMVVLLARGERVNVLKGHKRGRSARAAVSQGVAERAMRFGAFRVPRLLQHDGEHEALVFEHLQAREVELVPASAPLYARLGSQLAVFQRDESAAELKGFGPRDELDVLTRWRTKVESAVGVLPEGWLATCARLAEQAEHLPDPVFGLCHRDLHDRQVHLCGADIALFDFDLLCRGDVALDAGNLVAHLRWRAVQGLHGADAAGAHALESAFLAGLDRAREAGFESRFAFYLASACLRLSLVYRLRPRWSDRVAELVSRADAALDELASPR